MKREELIKRIKSWHLSHDDMKALAEVIPELRESEDERVRRELIDFLEQFGDTEQMIEWVNKWGAIIRKGSGLYCVDNGAITYIGDPATEPPLDITMPSVVIEEKSDNDSDTFIEDELKAFLCDYDKEFDGEDPVPYDIAKHFYEIGRKEAGEASHWKPGEEQMEAFKKYIEEFQARAEAAVGGWNNFDVMIRLYEQLKKL